MKEEFARLERVIIGCAVLVSVPLWVLVFLVAMME